MCVCVCVRACEPFDVVYVNMLCDCYPALIIKLCIIYTKYMLCRGDKENHAQA